MVLVIEVFRGTGGKISSGVSNFREGKLAVPSMVKDR